MKQKALPADINGQRICTLFDYPWKWIERPADDPEADWKTNNKYPIKPRVLWTRWQDAATLVGVRFGSSTRYAMIDIDAGSPYMDAIGSIKGALETIGINRTITLRSSWSGGLHIYCPLPQAYPTFSVACAIKQALEAQGFSLSPGQLEAFPNEKSYGRRWLGEFFEYNGHRLPLQPGTGSYLLDDDLQPMPRGYDLSYFFALWDNAILSNAHEEIAEALSVARSNRRRFGRRAKGKMADWKEDLERIINEGWTDHGQTNEMLKAIGTYGRVFLGHGLYDLAEYIQQTAIDSPGFSQYSSHQNDLGRRAMAWARAIEKFYWPLGTTPTRQAKTLEDVCFERAIEAQARIKIACERFWAELEGLSIKALVKRLCELAQCSATTLYKYRYLWHPTEAAPPQPGPATRQRLPRPVTPQPEGNTGDMSDILRQIRESLESTENQGVTGLTPLNEVCNLKSSDLKNLPSGGKERGCGGEKGFSTGSGWLPSLDWKPGAVGDCHA
ncbi:MAG: hypothetical protein WBA99_13525 [Nodosilinea sp.]